MRQPLKIALAVLLAAAFAAGCGSDDDSSSGGDAADKAKTSAQAATDETERRRRGIEPESDTQERRGQAEDGQRPRQDADAAWRATPLRGHARG